MVCSEDTRSRKLFSTSLLILAALLLFGTSENLHATQLGQDTSLQEDLVTLAECENDEGEYVEGTRQQTSTGQEVDPDPATSVD